MRRAGHVTRVEEMRNAYNFFSENLKGTDHFEVLGLVGKVIFKCSLRKRVRKCGQDLSDSGQVPVVSASEDGNENSGWIRGREFLHQLRYCYIFKKEPAL